MIAISSFRPFKFKEYAHQQVLAKRTWNHTFKWIYYFGDRETELLKGGPQNTFFLPCAGKPTIKEMCRQAFKILSHPQTKNQTWAAIINADIAVRPRLADVVDRVLEQSGAKCALSKRYEIPVDGNWDNVKIDGNALDFFVAKKEVWELASRECPEVFRLGHQMWDTWMASFFANNWPNESYDLTPTKLIFHPKHEDRGNQETIMPKNDPYLDKMRFPGHILAL